MHHDEMAGARLPYVYQHDTTGIALSERRLKPSGAIKVKPAPQFYVMNWPRRAVFKSPLTETVTP
jgi:hypothetical protein